MKKIISVLILFSCLVHARDFSQVKVTTQKVAGKIHMLQGAGGNIGVSAGTDGMYIIDDQFAGLHQKIKTALNKISSTPVRFVINTHWHGDHTGGNELFGKAGSVIIAHDNVRKRMSVENFTKIFKRKTPPAPKDALPVITFPDRMNLHLNGEEARIIHFSHAHTDGDSVVYFTKSNVVHTGDIFFNGFYPYIDVDSGGSLIGIKRAVKAILKIGDSRTKIIPGHGPLATKKDLRKYLRMLNSVEKKLAGLLKEGKTIEQVVALKPTAKLDAKWGGGFMKPAVFTRIAFQSLKKKR